MGRRVSDDTLFVRWDNKEQDFKVWFPNKCDGGFILGVFCNGNRCPKCWERVDPCGASCENVIDELEKRGYDPTTIRFSIKKKRDKSENQI